VTALTIAVWNGTDRGIEDEVFISQLQTSSALRRIAAQVTRFGGGTVRLPW
jgi:hypothetical protein